MAAKGFTLPVSPTPERSRSLVALLTFRTVSSVRHAASASTSSAVQVGFCSRTVARLALNTPMATS